MYTAAPAVFVRICMPGVRDVMHHVISLAAMAWQDRMICTHKSVDAKGIAGSRRHPFNCVFTRIIGLSHGYVLSSQCDGDVQMVAMAQ